MIIREAVDSDFDELIKFYDYMCQVLAEKDFMPNGNQGGFPSADMVREAIKQHNHFVGIKDGKIVSTYILDHNRDAAYLTAPWKVEATLEETVILHALRVLPDYSGRGYAKKLVEHAIGTARKRNQKAIRLDVIVGNTVPEKLFLKYGFEYIDTVEMLYEDIGEVIRFRLMELAL